MQPTVVECTRGVIAVHAGAEQELRGEFSATHRLTTGESSLQIDVAHADGGHFTAHFRRHSQNWLLELTATGINATLLKAVLSSAVGQLITDEQGTISVTLQAAGDAGGIRSATGRFAFDALAFDGTHVAEALSGAIKFAVIHRAADWFVEIDATLTDGIVYFEPGLEIRGMAPGFTLEVTGDKLRAAQADLRWSEVTRRLVVTDANIKHPGVGNFSGDIDISIQPLSIRTADLRFEAVDLAGLYPTYLQPLLIGSGAGRMEVVGLLDGRLRLQGTGIKELAVEFDDVHIDDEDQRFSLSALSGQMELTSDVQSVASQLTWKGASIYRIDLGGGKVGFSSQEGQITLTDWTDVAVLDGALRIDSFSIEGLATLDAAVTIGGELTPISLSTLTQALGWPLMNGKVFGSIPRISYRDGSLKLTGDLSVGVFDGTIIVGNLQVEGLKFSLSN